MSDGQLKRKNEQRRQQRAWLILVPLLFMVFGCGVYFWQTSVATLNLARQATLAALEATNQQIAAYLTQTALVDHPPTVITATLTPTSTSSPTGLPPTFTPTPNQGVGAVGNLGLLSQGATATATPTAASCFFAWNTEPDPDTAARLTSALDAAQVDYLSVAVQAYGEDYVCGAGSTQTTAFLVMDRTPLITLQRPESILGSATRLGNELALVVQAAATVDIERPRLLQVAFQSSGATTPFLIWELDYASVQQAAAARTIGSALFELGTVR